MGIQSLQRYDPTTGRLDPERTLIASIIGLGSTMFLLGAASGGAAFAVGGLLRGPAGQRLSSAFSAMRFGALTTGGVNGCMGTMLCGAEYAVQRGWIPDDEQSWQWKAAVWSSLLGVVIPAAWITRKYCMAFPAGMLLTSRGVEPTLRYVWGPAMTHSSYTEPSKNEADNGVSAS